MVNYTRAMEFMAEQIQKDSLVLLGEILELVWSQIHWVIVIVFACMYIYETIMVRFYPEQQDGAKSVAQA